jgi:excisionase family DNA binding protein
MTFKSDKDKLTLTDAATRLNVCVRTVTEAIRKGKLEPVRHGIARRVFWVTRESVEKLEQEIKAMEAK